jgi:hypothetical protein
MMMMTSNELISRVVKNSTMRLAGHQALLILKFKLLSEMLYNSICCNQTKSFVNLQAAVFKRMLLFHLVQDEHAGLPFCGAREGARA